MPKDKGGAGTGGLRVLKHAVIQLPLKEGG